MVSLTVRMRLRENTQLYLDTYLMGLTAGVPGIAHHELPAYLDSIELLRNGRNELANPFNPISWTLAAILQIAIASILLGAVYAPLALLPLVGVPAALLSLRTQNRVNGLWESQAEDNRILRHFLDLATTPGPAKEIRLYGLATSSSSGAAPGSRGSRRARAAAGAHARGDRSGVGALFALGYCAALAETVRLAQDGRISIGSVVLVLGIGVQLSAQLNELAVLHRVVRAHAPSRQPARVVRGVRAGGARRARAAAGPRAGPRSRTASGSRA